MLLATEEAKRKRGEKKREGESGWRSVVCNRRRGRTWTFSGDLLGGLRCLFKLIFATEFWPLSIPGQISLWWLKPQGLCTWLAWSPAPTGGGSRPPGSPGWCLSGSQETKGSMQVCKTPYPASLTSLPLRGKNAVEGKGPEAPVAKPKGPETSRLLEASLYSWSPKTQDITERWNESCILRHMWSKNQNHN